jgi:hypothetical protein
VFCPWQYLILVARFDLFDSLDEIQATLSQSAEFGHRSRSNSRKAAKTPEDRCVSWQNFIEEIDDNRFLVSFCIKDRKSSGYRATSCPIVQRTFRHGHITHHRDRRSCTASNASVQHDRAPSPWTKTAGPVSPRERAGFPQLQRTTGTATTCTGHTSGRHALVAATHTTRCTRSAFGGCLLAPTPRAQLWTAAARRSPCWTGQPRTPSGYSWI